MPVSFRGSTLIRPQAVSYVDDSALAGAGVVASQAVAVVGLAERGQPNTAAIFSDPSTARLYYGRGGFNTPLVDGITRVFDAGVSRVIGVRIGGATVATASLLRTAVPVISVTTKEWGLLANTWRLLVGTGTTGGKKLTLTVDDGSAYVQDNVTRRGISLQYTGAGTAPTVTITDLQLATGVTGDPTGILTLPFNTYRTLQNLADALNATGKWAAMVTHSGGGSALSNTLDQVTTQSVPAAPTAPIDLYCNVAAVADALNGPTFGRFVQATVLSTQAPVDNATYAFTGAVGDGTVNNASWTVALAALQSIDAQLVVPMTSDVSVHASVLAHCVFMSSATGKRERIAVLGGGMATNAPYTKADALTRAMTLNSNRAVLVWPAVKDFDAAGDLVTVPGFYTASRVAGQLAAQPDMAEPLTRDPVSVYGLEIVPGTTDVDDLILAGVLPIEFVDGRGYRVAQSITTWTGDTNLVKREVSCQRAADYCSRSVRDALDSLVVGHKAGPGLVALATNCTQGALERMVREGLIVGDQNSPAFRNINVRIIGDAMYIDYEVAIAIPANYVLITAHILAYGT